MLTSSYLINSVLSRKMPYGITHKNWETTRRLTRSYGLYSQIVHLKQAVSKWTFLVSVQRLYVTCETVQISFNIMRYSRAGCRVMWLNDEQSDVSRTPVFLVIEELNTSEVRPPVIFISLAVTCHSTTTTYTECIVVSPVKWLRERATVPHFTCIVYFLLYVYRNCLF